MNGKTRILIETSIYFLDGVIEEFLAKTSTERFIS
jgi:hypothetical protein